MYFLVYLTESGACDLPLFGHYCCRLAALPHCLVQTGVSGYLNLHVSSQTCSICYKYTAENIEKT